MRRYLFSGVGAALGLATLAFAAHSPSGGFFHFSSEPAGMGTVTRTDLLQQVTVAGIVVPVRKTIFSPPYNAYVKKIFVHLGDKVKEAQPVVSLVQSLRGGTEEIYPMRAPFDGTVVQVLRAEGEYVETAKDGNALVRVDDLSRLFVYCDVPEGDIAKIHVGQDVVIKANSILARSYKGVIREIALAAKEKKDGWGRGDRVEFETRMEILDKDALIHPGMSAIVDIITAKRSSTLALAHEYILKEKGQYFVTLEGGEKRKIEVGLQNEEMFEITRGLQENDRVRMVDFANLPQEN